MSPIAIVSWILAAASMTLAMIHTSIWWRDRSGREHLYFAVLACGVAGFALLELGMMRAATVEVFATRLRWVHVPIFAMVVGILAFVRAHFGTGRAWVAHAAWGINLVTLVVNFVRPPNADYSALTGIARISYLGETVTIGLGQLSAWHWIVHLSFLLVVVFVVDASVTRWRTGDREAKRQAAALGGTVGGFALLAAAQAALVYGGFYRAPSFGAPLFGPALLVMGYELGNKVLREASLVRDLRASEAALRERELQMRQVIRESQQLSRRLIDAQEDERRRIARELHDDHSQRLAVVALDLSALQQQSGETADSRVARALSEVQSLSSDLHALSYRLHPAKLDQLGLVSTARGWCRDMSATSGVAFTFVADGLPDDVRGRAGVSLFRILQEATRNVVRHSRATSARVTLSRAADGIRLVVEDNGRGFNVDEESRTRGLGLLSMEERARLLGGRLSVTTRQGGGTRVEATVPIDEAESPVDAARNQE